MYLPYLSLNAALVLWLTSLILWLCQWDRTALLVSIFAALLLLLHFVKRDITAMFGKEKNSARIEKITAAPPLPVAKTPDAAESPQANTVIAGDVRFDGNISATGTLYIHGKVYGNIEAADGMVKIMRSGYVEGNITARELVIDGAVLGQCRAETIDIQEHGNITGAIAYRSLAIKRGGTFSGQAETVAEAADNVVEMVSEKEAVVQEA